MIREGVSRLIRLPLEAVRFWRDRRRLIRSRIFDPRWYKSEYPELSGWLDLATHYLLFGARERRSPHPLFNSEWYLEQYPDVVASGANPLLHYLLWGAKEGRDPNAYFSSRWYLTAYPDVRAQESNPLAHYVSHGAREGRHPSSRFDPTFYLRQLDKDHPARISPLSHFLTSGQALGLVPAPTVADTEGEPVEWAQIKVLRPWTPIAGRSVALFVAVAHDGRLKPHVEHHLEALKARMIDVVLIIATDLFIETPPEPAAAVYCRENIGYDFAAWAHVLKLLPGLWDVPALFLLNDSVLGPLDTAAYGKMMECAITHSADIVGLTESLENGWHLQSYFLMLKQSALINAQVQSFFFNIRSQQEKQAVIDRYEVNFASKAIEAGLTVAPLFRRSGRANPTLFDWRGLLDQGYPFIKVSVVTGRHEDVDSSGWRERLEESRFDLALAEALLDPPSIAVARSPVQSNAPKRAASIEKIAFYGPWNYMNGLGEASRGYLSALWRLDAKLNIYGLKKPFHVHSRRSPGYDVRDFVDAADVAIVHLNPDGWHLLTSEQRRDIERAHLRIGIWVWEMSHIPDFFRPNFEAVDVIWTPSKYCAEVFAAATGRPVHVVPHVVMTPAADPNWGALHRKILYIFDGSSYLARKNPVALLDAFEIAQLERRGWALTLKTKNLKESGEQGFHLKERCSVTPGVTLIDRPMPPAELGQLLEDADIYASPHTSEGFGLTLAEAMAAGKTVVSTDFGGPRDFLHADTGYPVPYDLVRLDRDHGHYQSGGEWAQVDVAALAVALAQAVDRLERGDVTLARNARAGISKQHSPEAVADSMRRSLAECVGSS
jgi:glycosyltransferase involved in cell wall biosynthesis